MASFDETQNMQQACIDSANHLIELCQLPSRRISRLQEINSSFIVKVFESISDLTVPDLLLSDDTIAEVHNIQAVIDALSLDLLGLSLSHITGENVFAGDAVAILNLLEILEAVFLHLFSEEKMKLANNKKIPSKRRKSTSLESLVGVKIEYDDSPPAKILKRKTCKKRIKKSSQNGASQFLSSASSLQEHNVVSTELADEIIVSTDLGEEKKKVPKSIRVTQNVEHLHGTNFKKKVAALLLNTHSAHVRCQQLKQKYLKNLRSPMKGKAIPVCTKSFLLPHDLRQRPIQRKPSKLKKQEAESKISSEQGAEADNENAVPAPIQHFLKEFPGFSFPVSTQGCLTSHYCRHLRHMYGQLKGTFSKKPMTLKQAEKAEVKQLLLSNILAKDLKQKHHLRNLKEQQAFENKIKYSLRDARLRSAKIKQYFDEYHSSMQKKLQQNNVAEEKVIEQTFRTMLDNEKDHMHILCQQLREADEADAKRHRHYLESLQNMYQNQLSLMMEDIASEQKKESERTKEDLKVIRQKGQQYRKRLRTETVALQKIVLETIRDTHFREVDAQSFLDRL